MIETLRSDAFGGVLRAPVSVGISPIFRAKIRVGEESRRCYVKPLTDQIRCPTSGRSVANQEIVNEALGYVLAKACSLKVPSSAGVILLQREQIPRQLWHELDKAGCGQAQADYLCWFSEDMEYPSLKQRHLSEAKLESLHDRRLKRLSHQLAKNADSPCIIAFDGWLRNSDRNAGNLLESGPNELTLIDQGRILNFPNWTPGQLGTFGHPCVNRLQWLIDLHNPHWSDMLPNSSARIMAYNGFAVTFRQDGEVAARQVLAEFFDEQVDIDAIILLLHDLLDPTSYAKTAGHVL